MRVRIILVMTILAICLAILAGCVDDTKQANRSSISITTDNDITVNLLESNMTPLSQSKKDGTLQDSIKAKVSGEDLGFSSVSFSDDIVNVGEVVYIEGAIPQRDYPAEKAFVFSDPEGYVSFENGILSNEGDNTVFTCEAVGEKVGTTTVYVGTEDSDYYYSFSLEVTEATNRSMPERSSYTVYCTPTGGKYHAYGCSYLRGNGISIGLEEALAKGLGPCSRCNP